jgi:hypothetical protein
LKKSFEKISKNMFFWKTTGGTKASFFSTHTNAYRAKYCFEFHLADSLLRKGSMINRGESTVLKINKEKCDQ